MPVRGETVTASAWSNGEPVAPVEFDWGDGTPPETSEANEATHTYAEPGRYVVTARAVGYSEGSENVTVVTVPEPPVVAWEMIVDPLNPPLLILMGVTLEAHQKPLEVDWGDGSALEYYIDRMDDGALPDSLPAQHTYTEPGEYVLTVDPHGEEFEPKTYTFTVPEVT